VDPRHRKIVMLAVGAALAALALLAVLAATVPAPRDGGTDWVAAATGVLFASWAVFGIPYIVIARPKTGEGSETSRRTLSILTIAVTGVLAAAVVWMMVSR
jgi:hypothetical protein